MLRRTFFKRMGQALATAALAAHMELGSLVPVLAAPPKAEKWWYLVEVTDHTPFSRISRMVWIEDEMLPNYGLKPEDFQVSLKDGERVVGIRPIGILDDEYYPMTELHAWIEKN